MKRYLNFFLFLIFVSIPVCAQSIPPVLLYEAAHCLVTDKHNWLDPQTLGARELSLGYHPDAKTMLGDKYLYVVVYTTPRRNEGKIFDIRFKDQNHQHIFSIENSATFISSKTGVEFSVPPMGGTWAQAQFTPVIQQIVHHKWYTEPIKYLVKPSTHIQCESYADNDKK